MATYIFPYFLVWDEFRVICDQQRRHTFVYTFVVNAIGFNVFAFLFRNCNIVK